MNSKIIIAIDAMGGENSPSKNIEGVALFLKKNKNKDDFSFNLFGDEISIKSELDKHSISSKFYKIFPSSTVVSDEETPLTAIKNSKDSSMWNSINSQIESDSNITLSAGNTGVLFVVSRMLLKTIESVSKPALAGLWPNEKNMNVVLDLGANIECSEKNLSDFACMGAALSKSLFENIKPKIALLNVGLEENKGNEILKKTYSILKNNSFKNFEFCGYIEGNQVMDGEIDVIVTDGFTGNIALKTAEGTANFITRNLKKSLNKFSMILSYYSLKTFKEKLDPRKYNGAIFLGLEKPVVKSHGSTDAIGFAHSINVCNKIVKANLIEKIKSNLITVDG